MDWNWVNSISWGNLAEWLNAVAVFVAAIVARQSIQGYFDRRAAERKSDLAVAILEALYRYEWAVGQIRSIGSWLATCDVQAPQISEFQIAVRKVEMFDRRFVILQPLYEKLIELLPVVQAVFGNELVTALRVAAHTYDRMYAAKEGIRSYNIEGQNRAQLGMEFEGWDLDGLKIGPENMAYYWHTLLADEADTAEVHKQITQAQTAVESVLFPIVRAPVRGGRG